MVHRSVDLGVFLKQLKALGEFPFGGDQPAVAGQPRFRPLFRKLVNAVRLGLRGMVTPELDVGMRPVSEAVQFVQRSAVRRRRDHGAGREVSGDAHDVLWIDARVGDGGGDCVAQDVAVVVGNLEGPIGGEALAGSGEYLGHHGMRILEHATAEFQPVRDADYYRASGQRPEIDADDVLLIQG